MPLRQITGEPEFNELFIDGARIPDENVLGGVGNGWKVALTTLMNERAGLGVLPPGAPAPAARPADRRRPPSEGLLDDPVVADRLGELHLRTEIAAADRLPRADRDREVRPAGARGLADQVDVVGDQPAAHPARRRPARPEALRAGDPWAYELLRARGNSIEGGTTEMLKNIVAERVLGLPKAR